MSEFLTTTMTAVALSGLLVWLSRTWISAKLKASIQHEYDQKLATLNAELKYSYDAKSEVLKAEFQREAEKLRFATSTFGEAQKASHQRKLDAIETLWKGVMAITNNCPAAMTLLDVALVSEHAAMVKTPTFPNLLKGVELKAMPEVLGRMFGEHETARPYVGEYLWSVFKVYQTVVLRSCLLASQWEEDLKKLDWASDEMIRNLLRATLGEADFTTFERLSYSRFGWVQTKFTEKILQGINKVISGESFGVEALRQAELLEELVRKANEPQKSQLKEHLEVPPGR